MKWTRSPTPASAARARGRAPGDLAGDQQVRIRQLRPRQRLDHDVGALDRRLEAERAEQRRSAATRALRATRPPPRRPARGSGIAHRHARTAISGSSSRISRAAQRLCTSTPRWRRSRVRCAGRLEHRRLPELAPLPRRRATSPTQPWSARRRSDRPRVTFAEGRSISRWCSTRSCRVTTPGVSWPAPEPPRGAVVAHLVERQAALLPSRRRATGCQRSSMLVDRLPGHRITAVAERRELGSRSRL